jgi:hypothetical protein
MLPPAQKARFDNYLKEQESVNIRKKTDYTSSDKVTDMSTLEAQMPKIFSSSARENYNKTLNSEQFKELSSKITEKRIEIDKMDIEMEDLEEDLTKELA